MSQTFLQVNQNAKELGAKIIYIDEHLNLGFHSIIWDGTNLPSGIYFVKMEIDGYFETKKILLTK